MRRIYFKKRLSSVNSELTEIAKASNVPVHFSREPIIEYKLTLFGHQMSAASIPSPSGTSNWTSTVIASCWKQ